MRDPMRDPMKTTRPARARKRVDRRRTIPDPAMDDSAALRASAREDAICAISELLLGRYAGAPPAAPGARPDG